MSEHTLAVTAAALIIVFCAVTGVFALTGFFKDESAVIASQSDISASFSAPTEQMHLGVYNGYLALFVGESEIPSETYDIMARTLPKEDRARLIAGIPVDSEAELRRLIEDFTS